MSNPEGLAIARRLIAEEAEKQTGFLDLGELGLTELPEEIHQLRHLRTLNLSLWFRDATTVSDEMPYANRSFGNNNFAKCRLPQLEFVNLECLFLGATAVIDLTPFSGLANLRSLDCWDTLVTDLSPISGLTSLRTLNLGSTDVSDLSPLSELSKLRSLNCSSTPVTDLSPLLSLTKMQFLNIGDTSIGDLSLVSELSLLNSLDCSGTPVNDLSMLSRLSHLSRLAAHMCVLHEVPFALLREANPIKLYLHLTRIPGIPREVLSQDYADDCRETLLAHVKDLKAGAEPVRDVKVIVIGNGRIGKTQICNRLRGKDYEYDAVSTHGITVTRAALPMGSAQPDADLNLWDFGGQDLYHGTHALFLKSRAIFVVVWTPKSETTEDYEYGGMRFRNQPLPYWLDYVRHAAGQGCPVVLVQNQCDSPQDEVPQPPVAFRSLGFHPEPQAKRAANQDESVGSASSQFNSTWRAKTNAIGMESQSTAYDFAFPQIVHYSAKYDRKRDSLNDALREAVKFLHDREGISTIGKGRMRVRRQLQQWLDEDAPRKKEHRQHRTLTQAQFRQLCQDVGGVSSPESLLDYLHNAGIVFYRPGLFRDEIVLDQSWALDAIYTVFNREQCYRQLRLLGGRFTRSLLEALAWREYSRSEQELFLSYMTSCGICFVHRDEDKKRGLEAEYVAPDVLPDRTDIAPQLAGRWNESEFSPQLAWDFSFLSPSVARSIISRVGTIAGETAVYWKYGVWFYDATTRSCALIEQQMLDDRRGRIVLSAQGDRSRELLERVTEWIGQDIERDGGVSDGEKGGFTGRQTEDARAGSPCYEPDAAPLRITDPPRPANESRVCVSYAWKEERHLDPQRGGKVAEFCEKLKAQGVSVIRDTTDIALGDRLSAFMRQIGQSDCVYIFLSDGYLKSPNCMYELLTIWQTSGDDPEKFRARTRVYTMPGTDVFSIPARLKYAAHWKKTRDETRQLIEEHGVDVLGPTDLKHFKQIQDFAHHFNEMLAQIVDVLQPSAFDGFIDQALAELGS